MELAETVLAAQLIRNPDWRLHVAGTLDLLPDSTAIALKQAQERTRDRPGAADLTIAIGYSGRQEVTDAVRSWLTEAAADGHTLADAAAALTERDISRHLYHPDLPEPDLVIRTSGEQRMSDFLLWQATGADVHFCDVYWPAFRYVDLLRVLRTFGVRSDARRAAAGR
jgi:short-chain Z-isoprenyl diphosphate synthase